MGGILLSTYANRLTAAVVLDVCQAVRRIARTCHESPVGAVEIRGLVRSRIGPVISKIRTITRTVWRYVECRNVEGWLFNGLVHPQSLNVVDVAMCIETEKAV
jgi:hypothetical protein